MRRRIPRRPRKTVFTYVRPFVYLVLFVLVFYYAYSFFFPGSDTPEISSDAPEVFLSIEQGNAQILLWGEETWDNAPDGVKLFQGDTIKTDSGSRSKLIFFDHSIFRLDERSRIALDFLSNKDKKREIHVSFYEGSLWTNIEKNVEEGSMVKILTPKYNFTSQGGAFNVSENSILSISGRGEVSVKHPEDDTILKKVEIGVGQQVVLSDLVLDELKTNSYTEIVEAISDSFKESEWYKWNQMKDGNISSFEEEPAEDDEEEDTNADEEDTEDAEDTEEEPDNDYVSITSPAKNSWTNEDTITVKGKILDEKVIKVSVDGKAANVSNTSFTVSNIELQSEGENILPVEIEDIDGKKKTAMRLTVTKDTESPSTASIATPVLSSGRTAEIDKPVQEIIGKVPQDTYKVTISYLKNGAYSPYVLDKYVPGRGEFQYFAKTEFGNLVEGKNTYKVTLEDRAGNESDSFEFTLVYTPSEEEEAPEEADNPEEENTEENTVSVNENSVLAITSPNGGSNVVLTELPVFLRGTTYPKTDRIKVNGKSVATYTAGNDLWAYKLDTSLGNIKEGDNAITVEAFDSAGAKLGETSINIIIKLEALLPPTINRPTSNSQFTSTQKNIIIGGVCSPKTSKITINGTPITYTKGQTQWSTTVDLNSGDNVFRVIAESASGSKSEAAEIIIRYEE